MVCYSWHIAGILENISRTLCGQCLHCFVFLHCLVCYFLLELLFLYDTMKLGLQRLYHTISKNLYYLSCVICTQFSLSILDRPAPFKKKSLSISEFGIIHSNAVLGGINSSSFDTRNYTKNLDGEEKVTFYHQLNYYRRTWWWSSYCYHCCHGLTRHRWNLFGAPIRFHLSI